MKKMDQGEEKERKRDWRDVLMGLCEKGVRRIQGRDQAGRHRVGDHASGPHTIFWIFLDLLASYWAPLTV